MAGGYVICEYDHVKKGFPEYQRMMESLESRLIAKAEADWQPLKYGGLSGSSGRFSKTTIIPSLFQDIGTTRLVTWDQWFTAVGSQTIMLGAGIGGTIAEDYKVGFAGLVFMDKAIRISEIKLQISDKKLPRINIEEAFAYKNPAVVFEDGYILDEETGFQLWAFILSQGPQAIKLLGMQLNRVPNKLQVTNTGAALT